MKKVLILAYDFPPLVSVGALRPYSWYRHLKEFGIYPIVVTRQWQNQYGNNLDYVAPGFSKKVVSEETEFGLIIKTPYQPNLANKFLLRYGDKKFAFIRKLITFFFEIFQFFFIVGPKSNIYHSGKKFLEENKAELIIATGEPYILFHYASKLSKTFNIPWIADYRDPWSQDKSRQPFIFSRYINQFFERRSLRNVKLVITVSAFFQKKIEELIKNKPFQIITNGFDQEIIEELKGLTQNNEEFCVGFSGTIYKWHPVEMFLKVCNQFILEKAPRFKVNFYGINIENELSEVIINKYPALKNHVKFFPRMSNRELLVNLSENNLLLLFNYYSFMGTKIYDYLGIKRKILFCFSDDQEANKLKSEFYNYEDGPGNNNLQVSLLNYTKAGVVVKDSNHLYSVLNDLYMDFLKQGYIFCNSENVEEFSRKSQVKKLASILLRKD